MGHVQSCFGYCSAEAEPVPPLVRPRPGELGLVQEHDYRLLNYMVTLRNFKIVDEKNTYFMQFLLLFMFTFY